MTSIIAALIVAVAYVWLTRDGGWWSQFVDRFDGGSSDD